MVSQLVTACPRSSRLAPRRYSSTDHNGPTARGQNQRASTPSRGSPPHPSHQYRSAPTTWTDYRQPPRQTADGPCSGCLSNPRGKCRSVGLGSGRRSWCCARRRSCWPNRSKLVPSSDNLYLPCTTWLFPPHTTSWKTRSPQSAGRGHKEKGLAF
ncbi:hypothetical protein D3C87_905890 [compost metagenome]